MSSFVTSNSDLYLFFRLEKEYTTIKTKEMEEQVEIKVGGADLVGEVWTRTVQKLVAH